jgi:TonB family protein
MPGEDFSALVPPYWREFCSHMNDPDWSQKQLEKAVAESRARDKAETWPVPVHKPEPSLTREAHDAKINGTVVLSVGIDEYGHVSDVMVITPLGMGLDESTVETIRIWRFKPAQLNGHTKPVKIVVEIAFRLL